MPRPLLVLLAFALAVLGAGCADAKQQSAYAHAVQLEQQQTPTAETAPALIEEYQKVVRLDPASTLARQAETRIAALRAKVSADELHKSVFQEHGVD